MHVEKGAKFGVDKVNGGQNICNRVASVENGKNVEKQAQSSKGWVLQNSFIHYFDCQMSMLVAELNLI